MTHVERIDAGDDEDVNFAKPEILKKHVMRSPGLPNKIKSVTIVHAAVGAGAGAAPISSEDDDDDDDVSTISVEETLTCSSSQKSSLDRSTINSPRRDSMAIQMATLQASFAEKTAEEMKQIVDWYSTNNEKDRFTKVHQSRSLPDNPLACLDDEEDNDEKEEEVLEVNGTDLTPQRTNCKRSSIMDEEDEGEDAQHTPLNKMMYGGSGRKVVSSTSEDGLPDLAESPTTTAESPLSEVASMSRTSTSIPSSREAQEQHQVIKHLLETTQYMADIVLEYEQLSSASDHESPSNRRTGTTVRRRRRSTDQTDHRNESSASTSSAAVRDYCNSSEDSMMRPDRKMSTSSSPRQARKRCLKRNARRSLMAIGAVVVAFLAWRAMMIRRNTSPTITPASREDKQTRPSKIAARQEF